MNFNMTEVLEMDWDKINFYLSWLDKQRTAEAKAAKKAYRSG